MENNRNDKKIGFLIIKAPTDVAEETIRKSTKRFGLEILVIQNDSYTDVEITVIHDGHLKIEKI